MSWGLIIVQVLTIVTIVMALRVILHKQFSSAMSRLKNLDEDNLKKQQELDRRLKQLEGERRQRISEAESEALNVIERAKAEAKEMVEKYRHDSKEESKRAIKDVMKQKDAMLEQYKGEIDEKVIFFSKELVREIVDDEVMLVIKEEMIKKVIAALPKADMSALAKSSKQIEVLTDKKMAEPDEKKILAVMDKKGIAKKQIVFKSDDSVVGGLIIRCGAYVLDGSISNRMQKAIPIIKERLKFGI